MSALAGSVQFLLAATKSSPNIFTDLSNLVKDAIVNLTTYFSQSHVLNLVGSYGMAVIVTTLIIRSVLWPLYRWQYSTQLNMYADNQILQPKMAELRKKYKGKPQELNAEMQKMYQELGMSPLSSLSGCLPLVIQMPILFIVYGGIRASATTLKQHTSFLWLPNLSKSVISICCQAPKGQTSPGLLGLFTHIDLLFLPVVMAGLIFVQVKMMTVPAPAAPKPDAKGKATQPSQQEMMTQSMSKTMPLISSGMFLLISMEFAQGLVLYYAVTTCFGVFQQFLAMGWGNLNVPPYFPGVNRTSRLRDRREVRIKERIAARKKGGVSASAV